MLGDLGARVVKVESPAGDDTRAWGPPWAGPDRTDDARDSTYFLSANRNKESVVLDLKAEPTGRCWPGWWRAPTCCWRTSGPAGWRGWGSPSSGCTSSNPGLVVMSITGFGHDGPGGDARRLDQIAQGEGGLMA